MREAEVDEEWSGILFCLPIAEVIEHSFGVPGTAGLIGVAAFDCLMDDAELLVCSGVAVALFAGAHGGVSSAVEDGSDGVLHEARRAFLRSGADRQVPDGAAAHDHVPRGSADCAAEGAHVVGGIKDHAAGCQAVDRRRIQGGLGVVELEVERGLVVGEYEEDVRPTQLCGVRAGGKQKCGG